MHVGSLTFVIQRQMYRIVELFEPAPFELLYPDIRADGVHNQIQLTVKDDDLTRKWTTEVSLGAAGNE